MGRSDPGRPSLETSRLLLRPFEPADAAEVQRLAGEQAIADTTRNIPHPYADGMAEAWIESQERGFAAGRLVNFAITLRGERTLIGSIGLTLDPELRGTAQLGYWVGVPYWNRGYCTEAACAVVDYGFARLGLERIHAHHLVRNPASGRVLAKAGMREEGFAREVPQEGRPPEEVVLYGISRADRPRS
jgi:RimJ/RimL family protein N-acetyltransferase